MSDSRTLKLQVLFAGLDRLSAPIRKMAAGSKGLAKAIGETRREIGQLKKAQTQIAAFRGAEQRFATTSAAAAKAREHLANVRAEIEKVEAPTKKMTAALQKAERAEADASRRHDEQGNKLQELSRKLEGAGVEVAELGRHEDHLADRLRESNRQLEVQQKRLARIDGNKRRGQALQRAGGRIAAGGAIATATVTAPALMFGRDAAQMASDAAELQSAFDQTFKALARPMNAWAVATGDAMGRSTQEMQRGAITLGMLFNQAAPTRKEAAALSKQFAILSQDLSSFFNTSPEEALEKLRSGLTGEAEPLRAFGVFLSDAAVKQEALRMGLIKGKQELTEQQKILVRGNLILRDTKEAQGDVTRTFEGAANQARVATAAYEEMSVTAGNGLLPVQTKLYKIGTKLFQAFNQLPAGAQQTIVALAAIAAIVGPVLIGLGGLIALIGAIGAALGVALLPALGIFAAIIAAVALLAGGAYLIYQNWDGVSAWFTGAWQNVVAFFQGLWNDMKAAFDGGLWGVIAMLAKWSINLIAAFLSALRALGDAAAAALPGIWNGFLSLMKILFVDGLGGLLGIFYQFGANTVRGFVDGMLSGLGWIRKTIGQIGDNVVGWFKSKLGIKSPSRVFAQLGGFMMQGLEQGLDNGAESPIARLKAAGDQLRNAMAASILVATPAAAGTAGAPAIGARPPAAAAPVTINIYPQPGQDAQDIAQAVRREIEAIDRRRAAAERSSWADQD